MSEQDQDPELEDYLFKVTTRKGVFWLEMARRNVEEAELEIWRLFIELKLPYQCLELRKNIMGTREQHMWIDDDGKLMAGELLWTVLGRRVEFQANVIAMKAEFAAEREEYERERRQ